MSSITGNSALVLTTVFETIDSAGRAILTTRTNTITDGQSALQLNLGVLTTVFTPPSSCLNDLYYTDPTGTIQLGWTTKSECYPSNYYDPAPALTRAYYSPGVCPSGYTTACADGYLEVGTSAANCCPSGYRCLEIMFSTGNICTSEVESATFATNINSPETTVDVEAPITVYAPVIRVRWEMTDLPLLQPTSITTQSESSDISSTPTSTHSTTPTPTSTPASIVGTDATAHPSTLGTSAKIAIGVSIPLVIILLLVLGLLLYRRRKNANSADHGQPIAELETHGYYPHVEMSSDTAKYELPGFAVPVEADSMPMPHQDPYGESRTVEGTPVSSVMLSNKQHGGEVYNPPTMEPPAKGVNYEGGAIGNFSGTGGQQPVQQASANAQEDDELRWLQEEQDRLNERRERFRRLEELDHEQEERVRRRMQERVAMLRGASGAL